MILVIIEMNVRSEKRIELTQTIASLIGSIRKDKGCKRCDFYQSMENENDLLLLQEWDSQESLQSHMNSGRFRVLRGTTSLLLTPYKMKVHILTPQVEMDDK
jgi:quinol monooxygenase YgiN